MRCVVLALIAGGLAAGTVRAQELVRSRYGREPQGYLGISFTCPLKERFDANGLTVVHLAYPVIESVEPGSPAAAGGISAGDTIVAYDSVDVVNHEISMTRLLRPGRLLVVRVRRNGAVKDVAVRVRARPASFEESLGAPGAMSGVVRLHAFPGPMIMLPSAEALRAAGAALVRTNDDLRAALGAPKGSSGVLVVNVGEGSPANVSGLRAGDVVMSAGGRSIDGPETLVTVVDQAGGRSVSLRVLRAHQLRTVTLRLN